MCTVTQWHYYVIIQIIDFPLRLLMHTLWMAFSATLSFPTSPAGRSGSGHAGVFSASPSSSCRCPADGGFNFLGKGNPPISRQLMGYSRVHPRCSEFHFHLEFGYGSNFRVTKNGRSSLINPWIWAKNTPDFPSHCTGACQNPRWTRYKCTNW